MTSLLGRTKELAVADRWLQGDGRLLTIAGPPGVGKSRLARELARAALNCAICDLTTCRSAADVERAVQGALGGVSRARLMRVMAAHPRIIVLDRFEHLIGSARDLIASWIAARATRLVVTSREPLGLVDETTLALGTLDEVDAIALYAARAGRAIDAPVASAIVEKLDRLPLAIELAAARASVLSDRDLLARLGRGIGALDANLRATIRWSIELLSDDERATLTQCAVFRGAFDVDAAEAIVRANGDTVAHLVALERKSLVRRVGEPSAGASIALFDAVREVALDELARTETLEPATARHAEHHARLADQALAGDDPAIVRTLASRVADLIAAYTSVRARDPAAAARLVLAVDLAFGGQPPSAGHFELLTDPSNAPSARTTLR